MKGKAVLASAPEAATGTFVVCAVTVTYGDRWHLLRQVLSYLCAQPAVRRIIVVNNGATYNLPESVAAEFDHRVEVIGSGRNEGSARGFSLGMQAARRAPDAEFVWVLDDDNLPEAGALEELERRWRELVTDRAPDRLVLQALRTDRAYLMRIAAGDDPKKVFARNNSFLDFHIADAPRRVLRKLFGRRVSESAAGVPYAKIPYGVYGGLLFHKTLLDRVGYPDEVFYLYGDDYDYTARASDDGAVFLIPGSRVNDLDQSWHVSKQVRRITVLRNLADASDFRVYHTVRNNVFFVRRHLLTSESMWRLNRFVYLGFLRVYMAAVGKLDRYQLISEAAADGLRGRMGKVGSHAL